MTSLSDEMLMAYADGELTAADRAQVEAVLAHDPVAAERVAAFAATGRALGILYSTPMLEPVPQRLIEAVMGQSNMGPSKATATVIPFNRPQRVKPQAVPNWAMAASVAVLALGIGTLWMAKQHNSADADGLYGVAASGDGVKLAGLELAAALNSTLSATTAALVIDGQAASMKPVFSFAAASGAICRQYQINRTDAPPIGGVACRSNGEQWQIEGQVTLAASPPASERLGDGKIITAAGASSPVIDAIVDKIIDGDVMGLDQEAAAMKNGWRSAGSNTEPER